MQKAKIEDHPILIKLCVGCENSECSGECFEYKALRTRLLSGCSDEEAQKALQEAKKRMTRQKHGKAAKNDQRFFLEKRIEVETFRRANRAIEALEALCADADAGAFLMGSTAQKLLDHMKTVRINSCVQFIDWKAIEKAISAGGGK